MNDITGRETEVTQGKGRVCCSLNNLSKATYGNLLIAWGQIGNGLNVVGLQLEERDGCIN